MSESSRFAGRVGLASDFFEPDKVAHLAIEAPIERVAVAVENAGRFFVERCRGAGGPRRLLSLYADIR